MTENSQKAARGKGKPFQKGKSGNPGGRPPKTQEERTLEDACRSKSMEALAVIEEIMVNGQNERNRITAALAIIERGHGKPVQPATLSGPNGAPLETVTRVELVPLSK